MLLGNMVKPYRCTYFFYNASPKPVDFIPWFPVKSGKIDVVDWQLALAQNWTR